MQNFHTLPSDMPDFHIRHQPPFPHRHFFKCSLDRLAQRGIPVHPPDLENTDTQRDCNREAENGKNDEPRPARAKDPAADDREKLNKKLKVHAQIQLALAVHAHRELQRYFADFRTLGKTGKNLQQDLEPAGMQSMSDRLVRTLPDRKESAHGIADLYGRQLFGEKRRGFTEQPAPRHPLSNAPPFPVARCDDDVRAFRNLLMHVIHVRGVVLQVTIHHEQRVALRHRKPLRHG